MPYVKQEGRPELDKIVDLMLEQDLKVDGDLNYVLFSYFCRYMVQQGPSYNKMKNFRAELQEVHDHINPRILIRYEEVMTNINGDVPGAQELLALIRKKWKDHKEGK